MYKNDTGGPGGNLQFVSENADTYKKAFEQKNDTATKEMARLVDFIKFVNQAEAKDFQLRLKARLELDDFLRVTAVMLYGGAFDQLTGWNPHNFYLYHNRKQDRWRYLPWDLDVGFCATAFGRIAVLEHWNAAWPVPLSAPPNPLLERIISNPELLARYRQIAREILDKHFKPEPLCAIIDAKYALIKKDLVADPFPHQRATNSQDQNYEGIVASMKDFARQRYSAADRQLANPGERPQPVRRAGPPNMPPKLAEKIHQLQKRAERIQQHMRRIGPLLQRGKMEEAEKLVDEALNL